MIDNLDTVVIAEEAKGMDFGPLPAGLYTVKLTEVEDWKPLVLKSVTVKSTNETLTNHTIYNANIRLEVVLPEEHKGRLIFERLTTHPNIPWSVSGFLHAMGVSSLKLSEIATLKGNFVDAYVKIATYDKTITDPETGLDTIIKKEKNEVTRYKVTDYFEI